MNINFVMQNIGFVALFGIIFYFMYKIHKQDKESGWLEEPHRQK